MKPYEVQCRLQVSVQRCRHNLPLILYHREVSRDQYGCFKEEEVIRERSGGRRLETPVLVAYRRSSPQWIYSLLQLKVTLGDFVVNRVLDLAPTFRVFLTKKQM
jgi:hypothetical protein